MSEWENRIRQQAESFRRYPPLQSFERAATTLCEVIMDEINTRLDNAGELAIPVMDSLPHANPREGGSRKLGFFTTVQFLLGDEVLNHGHIDGKKIDQDTLQKLATIMRTFSSEQHTELISRFHGAHPQLKNVPELATIEKFFGFIDTIVREEGQNWLQGKPSVRMQPRLDPDIRRPDISR